jgi:hypothetical protein
MVRILGLLLLAGSLAQAAEMKGWISDAACGWNNARDTKEAKDCVRACLKNGFPAVFILDGDMNTYPVPDQAKVLPFAGERVAVTGRIVSGNVVVEKIRKIPVK